jgi:hypothetical protein
MVLHLETYDLAAASLKRFIWVWQLRTSVVDPEVAFMRF